MNNKSKNQSAAQLKIRTHTNISYGICPNLYKNDQKMANIRTNTSDFCEKSHSRLVFHSDTKKWNFFRTCLYHKKNKWNYHTSPQLFRYNFDHFIFIFLNNFVLYSFRNLVSHCEWLETVLDYHESSMTMILWLIFQGAYSHLVWSEKWKLVSFCIDETT